ncbi:universal stress protein [Bradyrhizobium japonicum]|uniref:universal stress protein n=1 Tax=Bradyrhizobium japonicum TaxID=375 RepID=UPI0020115E42|nr:universal stress protein [Bradyrhizobium japonicum]
MVATDGSRGACRAVDVAAELAKALACDLLIVTVADQLLGEEVRQLPHTGATAGRDQVARQVGSRAQRYQQ